MDFQLIPATPEHRNVISHLMQFYIYDFSEYVDLDVEDNGAFADYPHLEVYWEEENSRWPYILQKDGKYIGFILVRLIMSETRNYFSIAEFFVVRKYRRKGIGQAAAAQIFDLHRGQWEVFQKESNRPAQVFWIKAIETYTKGRFKERFEDGKRIQDFEN